MNHPLRRGKMPNRVRPAIAPFCWAFMIFAAFVAAPAEGTLFDVVNLVTDDQAANSALITDPSLKNAWGISHSATSPFWVSDNGAGVATLYSVDPVTNIPTKVGLVVSIPGDGSVTGQAFNGNSSAFNGDLFLFVNEDGTVSGWRGALGTTAEILVTGLSTNVYKGTTDAVIGGNTYLYAANFRTGAIDVFKGAAGAQDLTGNFTDPGLPSGYAPFDIQNINGLLYVTYALQDAAKRDDVPGSGHGFVSVFDTQGNFIERLASGGSLNSPWGLAIAPSSFGAFAGDLLVGNFGDGTINAFDPLLGTPLGALLGTDNKPLVIDGLWGLIAGNNGSGGSSQSIYFSAGPNGEADGLFGVITAVPGTSVPEPATLALIGVGLGGIAALRRRKLQ